MDNSNHEGIVDRPQPAGSQRRSCPTCRRVFKKAEHLERHLRSHLKQKPFLCPVCPKSFGRKDVLARHIKLHERLEDNNPASVGSSHAEPDGQITEAVNSNPLYLQQQQQQQSGPSQPQADSTTESSHDELQPPFQVIGSVAPYQWSDSTDILDMLMSEFNNTLPLTLPVVQANFSGGSSINGSFLEGQGQGQASSQIRGTGPGEQAMHQMSRLISDLSEGLATEVENTGITNSFLDTCIHVFFDKFLPSFPVLHRGTFSVKESSHPLLLNIMALGSLFIGAKDARRKGEALWRLAHTAVATSWQRLMVIRGPKDKSNGVQLVLTALLGQIYASLSKNENIRMTSQIFHSLGFYWSRKCGMLESDYSAIIVPSLDAPADEKEDAWRVWAAGEVQKRAVLGHYILDGYISHFSGYAASARHVTNSLLMSATEGSFMAITADDWIRQMSREGEQHLCFREIFLSLMSPSGNHLYVTLTNFSLRVILEGLQALVSDLQEASGPAIGTPSKAEISCALIRLYNGHFGNLKSTSVDRMELLIRWHLISLNMSIPSTRLCRKMCGFYRLPQQLHEKLEHDIQPLDLQSSVYSVDGHRAVLHAIALQDLIERLPIGRSHSIHLPAAIFAAATIYTSRCLAGAPVIVFPQSHRWEDVLALEILSHANRESTAPPDPNMQAFLEGRYLGESGKSLAKTLIYELNSLQITLASISSRWGVSHEMDSVLRQWISIANAEV